jgi:hypothetical protein
MENSASAISEQYLQDGIQEYLQGNLENAHKNWREAYSR